MSATMITPDYVKTMAHYNAWQNQSLYEAASNLSDEDRKMDRGAFFKSIHGTLCHVLWGDQVWLNRFADTPLPQAGSIGDSAHMIDDWDLLFAARKSFDAVIGDWAGSIRAEALKGDLTWFSGALNKQVSKPKAGLVMHLFNHQTHHRGQVHAMLTQAGEKPDDTDLFVQL